MAASTAHVSSTLFIRNLPYSATTKDLESLFGEIGPLKQCFVVTDRGVKDKCRGFGYVTFALRDDAEKALKASHSVEGRKLRVDYADRKPRKGTPKEKKVETLSAGKDESQQSTLKQVEAVTTSKHNMEEKKTKKKKKRKKLDGTENISEREKRRSRLIVRNLPFKCTEDKLKSVFEAFGTVTEISIPMKENKSMGFGFVQFDHLSRAAKALKQMNGKQIMNRTVAVDWTVPRTEYLQALQKTKDSTPKDSDDGVSDEEEEMEEEHDSNHRDMVVDEEEDSDEGSSQDSDVDDDSDMENKDEDIDDEDDDMNSDDDDEEDEEEDDEEEDEEVEDENLTKDRVKGHPFKKPIEDVQEGKTLFIRNVPYDSTDDDVSALFAPFGELEFARVVVDPMTEHSRGTAFVKFKTKEDAANCLHEGDAVRLNGRLLALSPAISRSEAIKLRTAEKDKAKEEQKDKRNLHLLREGLIRPGTKAAEGLSEQYMNKRLKIENVKKEKLKNLNIFVSPTRLAIHNLPKAVDDKKLREIAREAAGDKKAKVIEARIMRDMNNPNAQGVSKSLGFGFVEFSQYEHALATLLHLNSNAQLFGPEKRLIVGFSLENRRALEIKQRRREKALMKRQAFGGKPEEEEGGYDEKTKEETKTRKPYSEQRLQAQQKTGGEPHLPANRNMVMPQDGKKKGLPRHFGAKNRWRDRGKVADEKRHRRKEKRMVLQKQVWNSMKTPEPAGLKVDKKTLRKEKQKNQKRKQSHAVREEKQFNAMVSKYKQKITHGGDKKLKGSSKWFET
nr:RNA-binding protein 28-like isoform X2 [Lytechinus pictus]